MTAMAVVVLALGIVLIGGIISTAIWGIGKVLEAVIWLIGLVLRGVGRLVGTLIGWCIRGVRAGIRAVAERRYAAARRRRE